MFDSIKKLFGGKITLSSLGGGSASGSSVCGIDIGSGSIKVVQVKEEKGRIVLETYGALSLAPFTGEAIGKPARLSEPDTVKAITQVLQESRVTAKNFVISIQSNAILVFVVTLPRATEKQLDTVVPNEARKYIPVPLTEVSLDWFIIPDKETYQDEASAPSATIEVLVVAVRNETMQNYQNVLKEAKITGSSFEIESFATMRAVLRREIAPVLIVDIGTAYTSMMIVEYGIIRVFHVTNRGSAFVTESLARSLSVPFDKAEEIKYNSAKHPEAAEILNTAHEYLISEIKRVLLEYEHTQSRAVSKIILSGGGSLVNGFLDLVLKETGIEVSMADPFSKVDAPEFLRPLLSTSGPEFSVATGLALKNLLSF
jgi:type IV pilus assembly protein PilM